MPLKNHFRHQQYSADEPAATWRYVEAEFPAQSGSDAFATRVEAFVESVADEVDAIWFVHGTFAGNDALGWFGQLERLIPAAGPMLKKFGKKLTDVLAGDSGNFTPAFVELFGDRPEPGGLSGPERTLIRAAARPRSNCLMSCCNELKLSRE